MLLATILIDWWLRIRRGLSRFSRFLGASEILSAFGLLATLAVWVAMEMEQHPWTVVGLLRGRVSTTSATVGCDVALSIFGCFLLYFVIHGIGTRRPAAGRRRGEL